MKRICKSCISWHKAKTLHRKERQCMHRLVGVEGPGAIPKSGAGASDDGYGPAPIWTNPYFGCIHWEAKV